MKMRNKISRCFLSLVAVVVLMTAFSVPVFAQVPDSVNKSADAAPQEETEKKEEEKKDEEKKEEKTPPLTPDGNLTLVDDIKPTSDGDKQFMTVVSKNGNYFYIIVDRADNGENNVHFLNLVDERDLMDLIEEGTTPAVSEAPQICSCAEKCADGHVDVNCPVCKNDLTKCKGIKAISVEEPEPEQEKTLNVGALAGLIGLLLLGGGGAFYYFKFVKPKQAGRNVDELADLDYDDEDDDDEVETEILEDEDDEDEKPQFFKDREKQVEAYANKTSVINGEEKTREEIIDELFGGEDE